MLKMIKQRQSLQPALGFGFLAAVLVGWASGVTVAQVQIHAEAQEEIVEAIEDFQSGRMGRISRD